MDGKRFDNISRLLGARTGRRTAIGGLVAALLGSATLSSADAALSQRGTFRPLTASCLRNAQCWSGVCDTRRTAPRNQRNRCVCPGGQSICGGACTDTGSSMTSCGGCDTACDTESADACVSGVCTCGLDAACTGTDLCIDGICEDPRECTGANSVGQSCTFASDCCSLTCTAGGVCAEPTTSCVGYTGSAFNPSTSFCMQQTGRTSGAAFTYAMLRCGTIIEADPETCSSSSDCQAIVDNTPGAGNILGICVQNGLSCDGSGNCEPTTFSNGCLFFYGSTATCN